MTDKIPSHELLVPLAMAPRIMHAAQNSRQFLPRTSFFSESHKITLAGNTVATMLA